VSLEQLSDCQLVKGLCSLELAVELLHGIMYGLDRGLMRFVRVKCRATQRQSVGSQTTGVKSAAALALLSGAYCGQMT
jgi:hypothetical protein